MDWCPVCESYCLSFSLYYICLFLSLSVCLCKCLFNVLPGCLYLGLALCWSVNKHSAEGCKEIYNTTLSGSLLCLFTIHFSLRWANNFSKNQRIEQISKLGLSFAKLSTASATGWSYKTVFYKLLIALTGFQPIT